MKSRHVLITGGCRSGKSSHALALSRPFARRGFLATATADDVEMSRRIARHRAERSADWSTVEEPLHLADPLRDLAERTDVVVLDCVTLWTSNWLLRSEDCHERVDAEDAFRDEIGRVIDVLETVATPVVMVTNEVGLGIVPENPLARRFTDMLGAVNQRLAETAGQVLFMVSGIPWTLKASDEAHGGDRTCGC